MTALLERLRFPIMLVLILIIAAGLLSLYERWPRVPPLIIITPTPHESASRMGASTTPTPRQVTIKVHVAGAVVRPGVYSFNEGDRVEDAVRAAGGPTADADLTHINLAQRLGDEGQVIVPRIGETPVPMVSGSGSASSSSQSRKVNINTATASALEALPGIGPTYAKSIIDYRTKNGPFQRIEDLKDKKIIPAATFEKIKDLIDVR